MRTFGFGLLLVVVAVVELVSMVAILRGVRDQMRRGREVMKMYRGGDQVLAAKSYACRVTRLMWSFLGG